MSTHKEIRELLEGFALGELSDRQRSEVEKHASKCGRCSSELKRLALLLECADQRRVLSADEQLCSAANAAALAVAEYVEKAATRAINMQNVRSTSPEMTSGPARDQISSKYPSQARLMVVQDATWASRWLGKRVIIAASIFFVAGFAFGFAAKSLTPEERIEQIKEIQEEYSPDDREYTQADSITISGTVRTYDGRSLPSSDYRVLKASTVRKGYRGSYGINLENGRFSHKVSFGQVYLMARYEGYAPIFAGPLQTEPSGTIDNIDLILGPGFEARIRISDEHGDPVRGARLTGGYLLRPGISYNDLEFVSNQDGVVTIEHCGNKPLRFSVTAEGFEADRKEFELRPEAEHIWQLKQSEVTSGIVVSAATGEPIANARLGLVRTEGPSAQDSDPYRPETIALTDGQGRFSLTNLRSDSVYYLLVTAPGYGIKFPYKVMAGQKDLRIELGKELYIKGKVIGDLQLLPTRNDKSRISYSNPFRYTKDTSNSHMKNKEVEVRDGIAYFTIDGLWPGTVSIYAGKKRFTFEIDSEPLEDVVLDLTPEPGAAMGELAAKREVVVKFDTADSSAPPAGSVWISFSPEDRTLLHYSESLPIEDGQVRVEVAAPGRLGVRHSSMIGYYINRENRYFQIPAGEGPFGVLVPVIPAGSIYGEIFEHDGSKASNVIVNPVEVKSSPLKVQGSLDVEGKNSASQHEKQAKFVISPLPLGGEYVVVSHRNQSYVVSDVLEVDERNPIIELNMLMVEGVTVTGEILDPNGRPLPGVTFNFGYSTPWSHGFGGPELNTDNKGRFAIEQVNPDVPGYYSLKVSKAKGCRPFRMKVDDLNAPLIIKLEKAYGVSGVVVDDETGLPIPGVEVYALSKDYNKPEPTGYLDAEDKTDEKGMFRFTNMGQREYVLQTRGGQRHSNGKLVYGSYPVTVMGGQRQQVTIRKRLREGSNLKPRKPQDIGN